MKTILLLITGGLLISTSLAASIANLEAKRFSSEEGINHDRANSRKTESLEILFSPEVSDQENQTPLDSSEASENDLRKSPSSPEVVERDRQNLISLPEVTEEVSRKSILSSEVSEGLRKSPTSPKLSDEEIQIPLASPEVSENDYHRQPSSSPEIAEEDLQNDEFYQIMASVMEKAALDVLSKKDITSSSEVSENSRRPSKSSEIPEKDLQNLYEFFRYIASAVTKEEYSSKLRDSYPVWDVISSLLNGTHKACENSQTSSSKDNDNRGEPLKWWEFIESPKQPSKTSPKETPDDIGDWWKYIPDVKQSTESPREEFTDDVNDWWKYLPQEKKGTKSPHKFIDNDDLKYIPEGKSSPRRKIIQYWTRN